MTWCKKIPYQQPLNMHSGISVWTNVGSGVALLRPINKDGEVDKTILIQVPRDEWRDVMGQLRDAVPRRKRNGTSIGKS